MFELGRTLTWQGGRQRKQVKGVRLMHRIEKKKSFTLYFKNRTGKNYQSDKLKTGCDLLWPKRSWGKPRTKGKDKEVRMGRESKITRIDHNRR